MFDYSAILAYKSLFFLNRSRNAIKQTKEEKKCTAITNATRCAITASQGAVPLYVVAENLARTAKPDSLISNTAKKLTGSSLKDIAINITAPNRKGAFRALSKMGVAGNIAYALGKCADADEEDKTSIFAEAFGNTGGMYLFENCYSKVTKNVATEEVSKTASQIKYILSKVQALKDVRLKSILLGVGFVAASLTGCEVGEIFGRTLAGNSNKC